MTSANQLLRWDSPRPIAVGVDGSPHASRAVLFAADLARRTGDEVVVIHALGLLAHRGEEVEVPPPGYRGEIEERMAREWSRPLVEAEVAHRCLVVDGPPVDGLLAAARAEGAAVIVVGRRGSGSSIGLPIGSTSQQLAHRSDIPVVVVP
jgi:nucleotide-binding universal stress UspA family protein